MGRPAGVNASVHAVVVFPERHYALVVGNNANSCWGSCCSSRLRGRAVWEIGRHHNWWCVCNDCLHAKWYFHKCFLVVTACGFMAVTALPLALERRHLGQWHVLIGLYVFEGLGRAVFEGVRPVFCSFDRELLMKLRLCR
eukprot:SAG31_NODE_4662_length_3057_cov_56.886072_2_plen_140_part_00